VGFLHTFEQFSFFGSLATGKNPNQSAPIKRIEINLNPKLLAGINRIYVLTKMPIDPLGESRPPTMLNPRLFLRDPLENVTSQMAVESERERRNWADPPSTRSPLDIDVEVDGIIISPEVEASLSRRVIGGCFLALN
jgi:hypothetical protein